jgi:hypothetical protein
MKRLLKYIHLCQIVIATSLLIPGALSASTINIPKTGEAAGYSGVEHTSGISLPFIENIGQVSDSSARFYSSTFAGTVFVTDKNEIVYKFNKHYPQNREKTSNAVSASVVIKETLSNSIAGKPSGDVRAAARVSYFKGAAKDWKTDIPAWQEVNAGKV